MTDKNVRGAATSKSIVVRQVIFSLAALGIMGAGAWSLMGQTAPYHPEIYSDEVARNDTSPLTYVTD